MFFYIVDYTENQNLKVKGTFDELETTFQKKT